MNLLTLSKVNKFFGERCLFQNVSFSVEEHDKIGLIGANGTGKTTLFKMLLDGFAPDGGEIYLSKNTNFGYLEQHIGLNSNHNVYDELLTVFSKQKDIEERMMELTGAMEAGIDNGTDAAERLHVLTEAYTAADGYTYKNVARAALLGMGFTEDELLRPFSSLSGGQKTRVHLCKILLGEANLLLLDEPTNHLDIKSVEWLENFLQGYKGAFIVISHDRYFLDKVTNKTFEMEHGRLICYDGSYSAYLKQKQENEKYIARKYENTLKEISRIEGIIEQQKRWNQAHNYVTAASKQKVVDKLKAELVSPEEELDHIKPRFTIQKNGGNDVLKVDGITKGFEGNTLFSDVSFLLRRKERAFLLGENGCGKTTLFKIITGVYDADAGSVSVGVNVDIGYFDQIQEFLNRDKTLFDEISDSYPEMTNTEIRNALAGFLFRADDVFKLVGELSGGERARLMLLKLMIKKANFLLLDEPTNHLDIRSREMLEDALSEYDGTIFAISHDRYFINKLANRIIYMDRHGIADYLGDYDYFLEKSAFSPKSSASKKKVKSDGKEEYQRKKRQEAEFRKQKNRLIKVEKEIEETEQAIERIKEEMLVPEVSTDYVKCAELASDQEQLEEKLLELYTEWESLQSVIQS